LIGEDISDEKDLPFKHKQGLIVKQMQNMLVKNNNKILLYKDWVYKQGKGANKKISKRLMLMNPKEIMWYHNAEEFQNGKVPLGVIKIENIYKTSETLMQEGTYDFDICVISYIKKG